MILEKLFTYRSLEATPEHVSGRAGESIKHKGTEPAGGGKVATRPQLQELISKTEKREKYVMCAYPHWISSTRLAVKSLNIVISRFYSINYTNFHAEQ